MIIKLLASISLFLFSLQAVAQATWRIHKIEKNSNPSFFEKGKELPKLLIEGVKRQKLTPYQLPESHQIPQKMSAQDFKKNMKIPQIKGALITDDSTMFSFPENAQWFTPNLSLFTLYESSKEGKPKYLALHALHMEKPIFIAAFRFKDVEKILRKTRLALWQSPVRASFGDVLHLDIDDGSAYRVAKILLRNSPINSRLVQKINDESLAYQWLVRPIEQKINKNEYQPVGIEVYQEDSIMQLVGKFDFEQVKSLITAQETYFLSYTEALKQKLFVSDIQAVMPKPTQKEKKNKLFKKRVVSDLDLKENENRFFFQQGQEITKLMIEGFENGQINAYWSDSLQTKLSRAEFKFNLSIPQLFDEADSSNAMLLKMWEIRQLYKLNLVETMSFDQNGRRKTYQTKAIAIVLPAQENLAKGIDEPLAYFSYKEVIKLLKKKKQFGVINLLENRNFKAIPLFMQGTQY
jgi:hypothetical protein